MAANPRRCCLHALLEWEKGRTFSDEILHSTLERERLPPLDRSFFMETFFGVLRNLSSLDYLVGLLREGHIDLQTRQILRLGLYQIFHLRTAEHAAVNETVNLAGRTRGLVNAVLRRALREKDALNSALAGAGPAVAQSHPEFLVQRWEAEFGAEAMQRLLTWNNTPAEVFVRANSLKVTPGELRRSAPAAEPSEAHPLALRVKHIPASWLAEGLCYVQDPSTLLACDLLDPRPGELVLDMCAAPGGKATYLAALMENEGRLIACDLYASRLIRLRENLRRLGVRNARTFVHDCMTAAPPAGVTDFDRILVDAPCSNTGVIRRRVDVRWRLTEEDFVRMPAQQLALLRRAAALLRPGGTLVYSTCSLEREENDAVVERALMETPGLRFLESRRTLPFADAVDGAFAAKFTRD